MRGEEPLRVLRVGLAQIDCTVGAIGANVDKMIEYAARAAGEEVDLLAFPELAVCGYPPEDLLFKPQFVDDSVAALARLASVSRDWPQTTLIVGCLDRRGEQLYNAAAVIYRGEIRQIYRKHHLPNYGVFDEKRYFTSAQDYVVIEVSGVKVGISICEDIWHRDGPPGIEVTEGGAEVVVNLNASPYHIGKEEQRRRLLADWVVEKVAAVAYVNLVGGQDELVFDGGSLALGADGKLLATGLPFEEELVVVEFDGEVIAKQRQKLRGGESKPVSGHNISRLTTSEPRMKRTRRETSVVREPLVMVDEVGTALRTGVTDYVSKNNFSHVVLGLSGGIDSALTAVVAVEALGAEKVTAAFLPSRYTLTASLEDAAALAENLGIEMITIPIEQIFRTYLDALADMFANHHADVTEENLQARIRGGLLMALSNKFGWLLLSTGNKSETSVGYATLYGDMSGGFAVLKDVSKTLVYHLAKRFNERHDRQIIPERIITRAPSAELSLDQKDSDSLPEYGELDAILRAYIEEEKSPAEIVAGGAEREMVAEVIQLVDQSEYKRRQGPPGVKITARAFGKDWRVPITNLYRGRS